MTEYYNNGMVKLKSRIEDEFWYSDYQTVMELAFKNNYSSLGEYIEASEKEIASYRTIPPQMFLAIRFWCILHLERSKHLNDT